LKRTVTALLLVSTLSLGAQDAQQTSPPAPAAPRDAKIPQAVEKTLDNGLRVIVVQKSGIPLVASRLLIKTGGAADPAGKAGLAQLTSTVLTQGTKTKSAEQIARGVEALGATLTATASWDATLIDLSVMSTNLAKAMEYVADVTRNATFAKMEFEREQGQAIDAVQVDLGQPRSVGTAVAARLIFGEGSYGGRLDGTPKTLGAVKREDLARFHREHYRPDNAVLLMAGDVEPDAAFALAQRLFGSWPRGTGSPAAIQRSGKQAAPRVVVIDMPEAGQAAVAVGRQGIRRSDPAYVPALVTNSVLGGGYSSRLNQEIRIKRGLSYGAGSSFDARVDVGPFVARTETKHESAAEVASIIAAEMARLSAADVPESELTPRKAALIGNFAQSLETTGGIVDELSSRALYGLPLSDVNAYIGSVQKVQAADVRKFASANVRDLNVVIVGDASKFIEPLRAQYPQVEVISYDELDLASPSLRVRKAKR
jgi:zinc protease